MKMNKKGFTIVELVIVIAVIAILAAVLIPTFSGVINKAKENSAMQTARTAYLNWLAEDDDNVLNSSNVNISIRVEKTAAEGSTPATYYYFDVTAGELSSTSVETPSNTLYEISGDTLATVSG